MFYRSASDDAPALADLLEREAQEHDRQYASATPFGLPRLEFTPDDVWRVNDYAFKPGTYRRGYRKRRLFQLMELDKIAGKKVLDVGCGIGQHSVFFSLYGAQCYGFDVSSVGIATGELIAKKNNVEHLCKFAVASASDLPYEDHYFDIVVMTAVLHHIIKYPNVQSEIWRVLKPGGKIFLADAIRDNAIYKGFRWIYRKSVANNPVNLDDSGDVDVAAADVAKFLNGYENQHMERFTLLEGLREGFARYYNNNLAVRAAIFVLFGIDRILFSVVPATRNYTSEYVLVASKPMPESTAVH